MSKLSLYINNDNFFWKIIFFTFTLSLYYNNDIKFKQSKSMTNQEKEMERLGFKKHKTYENGETSYHPKGRSLQDNGKLVTPEGKVKPYNIR